MKKLMAITTVAFLLVACSSHDAAPPPAPVPVPDPPPVPVPDPPPPDPPPPPPAKVSVSLAWDANPEDQEVAGYIVSMSVVSGYHITEINVGAALTTTIEGLDAGTNYYFAAKAYRGEGDTYEESEYCSEISWVAP